MATDALDIPGVREMSWTKAGARMAGGDKEFDRLVPSAIFVEDGMLPRSHAVTRERGRVDGSGRSAGADHRGG